MTIEEVQVKRRELEGSILELLAHFEKESSVGVSAVDLKREFRNDSQSSRVIWVSCTVEL